MFKVTRNSNLSFTPSLLVATEPKLVTGEINLLKVEGKYLMISTLSHNQAGKAGLTDTEQEPEKQCLLGLRLDVEEEDEDKVERQPRQVGQMGDKDDKLVLPT